ncbi:MAG: archaemetzincin [Candidatus Methanomethyliaceae archaeon]
MKKIILTITEGSNIELLKIAENCYRKKFLNLKILNKSLPINDVPFRINFKGLKQYLADAILEKGYNLIEENSILIIITDFDIYTHGTNYIFGLATKYIGLISSARIDPKFWEMFPEIHYYSKMGKDFFIKQYEKVLLHELGHTISLPHCNNIECVMRYSNSPIELYSKGEDYCKKCWEYLKNHFL